MKGVVEKIRVFLLKAEIQRRLKRQRRIMGRGGELEELRRIAEKA